MSRAELQESSISRLSSHYSKHPLKKMNNYKGRTIRKLMGGGGRGGRRSTKKLFAQGKITWKKIQARQLILKVFMLWPSLRKHPFLLALGRWGRFAKREEKRMFSQASYDLKKILTRNLITKKKNSCGSKIPLPPHNFSNGPSLTTCGLLRTCLQLFGNLKPQNIRTCLAKRNQAGSYMWVTSKLRKTL